jgi:hypothetical protein
MKKKADSHFHTKTQEIERKSCVSTGAKEEMRMRKENF